MQDSNLALNRPSFLCIITMISLLCCILKVASSMVWTGCPKDPLSISRIACSNIYVFVFSLLSFNMQIRAVSRTLERQQPRKLVKQLSWLSILCCAISRKRQATDRLSCSLESLMTFLILRSFPSMKSSMKLRLLVSIQFRQSEMQFSTSLISYFMLDKMFPSDSQRCLNSFIQRLQITQYSSAFYLFDISCSFFKKSFIFCLLPKTVLSSFGISSKLIVRAMLLTLLL